MKFTLVKELRDDALMRPLLAGLLLFMLAFLPSELLLEAERTGVTPETAAVTLYGDAENFMDPLPAETLLEQLHAKLFFTMFTLLTLGAVYIRLMGPGRFKTVPLHLTLLAALAEPPLLLLAYYRGEAYLLPWLGAFWLWHAGAFVLALVSLGLLFRPGR